MTKGIKPQTIKQQINKVLWSYGVMKLTDTLTASNPLIVYLEYFYYRSVVTLFLK